MPAEIGAAKPDSIKAPASAVPPLTDRMAVLRWFKINRLSPPVPPFREEGVSPEFAAYYGLTPAETVRINWAYQQTKQRLESVTAQRAQLAPASTNEKLVVTVPAFPTEGGQVYNDLLLNLASVLGPARYELFNEVSGASLDNDFEGFGTAESRYEIILVKADPRSSLYRLSMSYSIPVTSGGGVTGGSSIRVIGGENLPPLLARFPLPTKLPATAK